MINSKGHTVTRRSAGIPAILLGLIAPDISGQLFSRAFSDLKTIALSSARQTEILDADLPQVHALNSLRAMFTTTRLALKAEPLIVPTMEIAALCLGSDV